MRILSTATLSVALFVLGAAPGHAAALSALNAGPVQFSPTDSEATIMGKGAASIAFGNTKIYIGYNQVSGNNQDPVVISFTSGVRNWVQNYDQSGIDARGIGLLWDEVTQNLYAAFTADGGSVGANSFSTATQGGWLSSYGSGGGAKASVLLKLNPQTGVAEEGTYIRAKLPDGRTNTVVPTGLDFVDNQVVFFGDTFFVPLDVDGNPFENRTTEAGSPFPYRVVFSPDLTTALSAEAIGWEGVTAFSPLESGSSEPENPDNTDGTPDDPDNTGEVPDTDDDTSGSEDPIAEDLEETDTESIPEPSLVFGLGVVLGAGTLLQRGSQSRSYQ